jgi:hypothetical protein
LKKPPTATVSRQIHHIVAAGEKPGDAWFAALLECMVHARPHVRQITLADMIPTREEGFEGKSLMLKTIVAPALFAAVTAFRLILYWTRATLDRIAKKVEYP